MEIDDKMYKQENYYNRDIYDGYEADIKNYIETYNKQDYEQIIKNDKRTNIFHIFSKMKSNIIRWYQFEKNASVLEIGANYGEITQELVEKHLNVTSVEFSREKAECISKRLFDAENLKLIICSDLKELNLEKYDYITLIGVAEYAAKLGFKNISELINWAYDHLNENGKVFLAIDNKFGVKYLVGSTRNKSEVTFANFKPYLKKDYKLYGKTQLEEIIKSSQFENYKFYYPVPNYNITNLIYTDKFLPKRNRYNIYYREDEEILFSELSLIDEANRNQKFDFFTNSFLIELNKNNILNNLIYANYSNMRKKQYKILTKITEDEVTKEAFEPELGHIEQIEKNISKLENLGFKLCEKYEQGKILSKYISVPTMDEYLITLTKQGKIEEFENEIEKWYQYIRNKFETTSTEKNIFEKYEIIVPNIEKLTFLKDGFIDLVFQNIFYEGGEYIVFDQEWYEQAVPLEFIMYRSIKQLFFQYEKLDRSIDKQKLYEKYNITEFVTVFEDLEEKWQKNMVEQDIYAFYAEKWTRIKTLEDIKFEYNQQLGKVYEQKDKLQLENETLQKEKEKLQKEKEILQQEKDKIETMLQEMQNNSRFYKIMKFIKGNK